MVTVASFSMARCSCMAVAMKPLALALVGGGVSWKEWIRIGANTRFRKKNGAAAIAAAGEEIISDVWFQGVVVGLSWWTTNNMLSDTIPGWALMGRQSAAFFVQVGASFLMDWQFLDLGRYPSRSKKV